MAKETIVGTTSEEDKETITATKEIAPRTISKGTRPPLETPQMHAFNAEK